MPAADSARTFGASDHPPPQSRRAWASLPEVPISTNREIPWMRAGLEGVVIVVSILLAFGIDAWWDERQERAEEREALAQLESDFRANAIQLDTIRFYHQRALDAGYEILARAGLGGEPRGGPSAAELVLQVGSAWNYDPVLGGINSLIQSGKLGILQNDSLRIAIAGWPDVVRDLNGDENQQQEYSFDRLRPHLMDRGVLFDALMAGGMFGRLEQRPVPDMAWILEDSLFLEMVGYRVIRLEEILAEVALVDQSIQTILSLVEAR